MTTRREFLTVLGGAAVAAAARPQTVGAQGTPAIRFAYHAITWGGKDLQAIEEIAAAGFKGIQLRANLVAQYGERPGELKALLDKHGLTLVCFSSGNVLLAPEREQETLALHTRHAQFVQALGGLYLQVTDERPKDRNPNAADFKRMGTLLTELGKRCADHGVTLAYHNHMNNLGEKPEEVAAVLEAADPKTVKLLLDVAHYTQGGGDPVKAVHTYRDRIELVHAKDVRDRAPRPDGRGGYQFVELGRGRVNLTGTFDALKEVGFDGWAIIELDGVPDPGGSPKESMMISRKYVTDVLKLPLGT